MIRVNITTCFVCRFVMCRSLKLIRANCVVSNRPELILDQVFHFKRKVVWNDLIFTDFIIHMCGPLKLTRNVQEVCWTVLHFWGFSCVFNLTNVFFSNFSWSGNRVCTYAINIQRTTFLWAQIRTDPGSHLNEASRISKSRFVFAYGYVMVIDQVSIQQA